MSRIFFFGAFLLGTVFLLPFSVSGASTTPCVGGTVKSGICFPTSASTGLSSAPVTFLIMNLMNWLLAIFGLLAIIAFVISGLQYITATGDEKQAETAKRNATYSIIGIIVALSGFVIIKAIDQALNGLPLF